MPIESVGNLTPISGQVEDSKPADTDNSHAGHTQQAFMADACGAEGANSDPATCGAKSTYSGDPCGAKSTYSGD